MPSDINIETIDTTYPVPGKDNSTQGFRDNYSAIKTALTVAKAELTDLIDKTARRDVDNDFTGVEISNAVTREFSGSVIAPTEPLTEDQAVRWTDGELHSYIIGADNVNLVFQGWPEEDRYAKIRVVLRSSGDSTSVTVNSIAVEGLQLVLIEDATDTITLPTDPDLAVVIEAWTYDGGKTVYINLVGKFEGDFTLPALGSISDVNITSPTNGQVLKWNTGLASWVNAADNATVANLNDILNVQAPSPADKQVLQWNNAASRWQNVTLISEYRSDEAATAVANAAAIPLPPSANWFTPIGIESATLAAGTEGQTKTLFKTNATGVVNVSVANAGWKDLGNGTVTLSGIGTACTLQYLNSKWYVVGNNGCTFS
jgi:hypothetical protein